MTEPDAVLQVNSHHFLPEIPKGLSILGTMRIIRNKHDGLA